MTEGIITSINGPIVHAVGMADAAMMDLVYVGNLGLIGEIIRFEEGSATIQVYEDNTGLKTGAPAVSTGRPLSALLGPGLLGGIYDGIQRPLKLLFDQNGTFMAPGGRGDPLDLEKRWRFVPDAPLAEKLARGEKVPASPGLVLGAVQETESVSCKIMVRRTAGAATRPRPGAKPKTGLLCAMSSATRPPFTPGSRKPAR